MYYVIKQGYDIDGAIWFKIAPYDKQNYENDKCVGIVSRVKFPSVQIAIKAIIDSNIGKSVVISKCF
jgi:hypothetical protein